MKGKTLLILLIIFIFTTAVVFLIIFGKERGGLVGPSFSRIQNQDVSVQPSSVPPQAPKSFDFDSSTDLKAELEKINPEVLDSDFD